MAAELDVNWLAYDTELAQSYPGPSKKILKQEPNEAT
jgi:hypothetical protein